MVAMTGGTPPLRLTQNQLFDVMTAANQIPRESRGIFLERLAAELVGDYGDADVHRAAHRIARAFRAAPPAAVPRRHETTDIRGWSVS